MVLDGGACAVGIESTIVDCTRSPLSLLRPGQVTVAQLEAVLGLRLAAPGLDAPRASGTLASHYAPAVPLRLLSTAALLQALGSEHLSAEKVVAVYSRIDRHRMPAHVQTSPKWLLRRMPDDADAAAQELFASLRDLEAAGVAGIWVEEPPATAAWDGVRDRLTRAAA